MIEINLINTNIIKFFDIEIKKILYCNKKKGVKAEILKKMLVKKINIFKKASGKNSQFTFLINPHFLKLFAETGNLRFLKDFEQNANIDMYSFLTEKKDLQNIEQQRDNLQQIIIIDNLEYNTTGLYSSLEEIVNISKCKIFIFVRSYRNYNLKPILDIIESKHYYELQINIFFDESIEILENDVLLKIFKLVSLKFRINIIGSTKKLLNSIYDKFANYPLFYNKFSTKELIDIANFIYKTSSNLLSKYDELTLSIASFKQLISGKKRIVQNISIEKMKKLRFFLLVIELFEEKNPDYLHLINCNSNLFLDSLTHNYKPFKKALEDRGNSTDFLDYLIIKYIKLKKNYLGKILFLRENPQFLENLYKKDLECISNSELPVYLDLSFINPDTDEKLTAFRYFLNLIIELSRMNKQDVVTVYLKIMKTFYKYKTHFKTKKNSDQISPVYFYKVIFPKIIEQITGYDINYTDDFFK